LLAIGFVLLGSIAGGLLPVLSATARTRALLRTRLESAVRRFAEKYNSEENAPPLLWDMSGTMGPGRDWRGWLGRRWTGLAQAEGVAGLYAELKWARSEDDLRELAPRVEAAIGEIAAWLRVFEPATKLRGLHSRAGIPDRAGRDWFSTALSRDTEGMLAGLPRRRPATIKEADALGGRCIDQYLWHSVVLDAWTKVTRAQEDESLSEAARAVLGVLDFTPIVDASPPPSRRTADGMVELEGLLVALIRTAKEHAPGFDGYGGDTPMAEILGDFLADVEPAGAAASWGALEQRAALIQNEVRDVSKLDQVGNEAEQDLQRFHAVDWAVTSVLALGAVIVFVKPIYTATWGSTGDILAAMGAGFGSQVVVQWGAMPVVRSIRTRAAGESDAGGATGATARADGAVRADGAPVPAAGDGGAPAQAVAGR
jgi:hypothetical protein